MSRSLSGWQAFILGLAVLTGMGLAASGLFAVGSQQWLWGTSFHVRAGFREIHGVEVGTRVRVLGRDAGEVESVDLPAVPSGVVLLRLRLDGHLHQLIRQDATAQIVVEGMVGGKVVEISPGSDTAAQVRDDALIASVSTSDLTSLTRQIDQAVSEATRVLQKMDTVLEGVGKGQGSLGKLVQDDQVYQELLKSIHQVRGTMASLKQNADALKEMPVVRNYVLDAQKILVRPDCARSRKWFREADLFEPGRAVLTAAGRQQLDNLAPWLNGLKRKGSEVVVASYAYPNLDPDFAQTLTQKQSAAVCKYLKDHHAVHKLGWFTRRNVLAVGMGTDAPPVPESEQLPLPRVEVLVFVPQG